MPHTRFLKASISIHAPIFTQAACIREGKNHSPSFVKDTRIAPMSERSRSCPQEWLALSCAVIYLFHHWQTQFVDLPLHRGTVGRFDASMAHCEIGDHSPFDDPMSVSVGHCSSLITGCVSHRKPACSSFLLSVQAHHGRHVHCCMAGSARSVCAYEIWPCDAPPRPIDRADHTDKVCGWSRRSRHQSELGT